MKRMPLITTLFLSGFIALMSCSKSTGTMPPATGDSSTHKINILPSQFDPPTLTILAGTAISWTNTDNSTHSIVADDGISFNSGSINPGSTYNVSFSTTGTFAYHCGEHPAMKGIIYVVYR